MYDLLAGIFGISLGVIFLILFWRVKDSHISKPFKALLQILVLLGIIGTLAGGSTIITYLRDIEREGVKMWNIKEGSKDKMASCTITKEDIPKITFKRLGPCSTESECNNCLHTNTCYILRDIQKLQIKGLEAAFECREYLQDPDFEEDN